MTLTRSAEPEALDDLELSGPVLERTLSELGWINRRLGLASRIAAAVERLAGCSDPHVVDLGCGGGDMLRAIQERIPAASLHGIDGNRASLDYAAARTEGEFTEADLLDPDFEVPPCDVLVSTHFLYHLPDERLLPFLSRARARTQRGIVVGELCRSGFAASAFGWLAPWVGLSEMTVQDGVRAVERAWTVAELSTLLAPIQPRIHRAGFSMVAVIEAAK